MTASTANGFPGIASIEEHHQPAQPDLVTFRVRIVETHRYLSKGFVSRFKFDATPESVAEFTDELTAGRVAAMAEADLVAPSLALGLEAPAHVEVSRMEWFATGEVNDGFAIWQADARADECHRQARIVLAERRPAHLAAPRRASVGR